jgi:hypothetical protein
VSYGILPAPASLFLTKSYDSDSGFAAGIYLYSLVRTQRVVCSCFTFCTNGVYGGWVFMNTAGNRDGCLFRVGWSDSLKGRPIYTALAEVTFQFLPLLSRSGYSWETFDIYI